MSYTKRTHRSAYRLGCLSVLVGSTLLAGPMSVGSIPALVERSALVFVGTIVQQHASASSLSVTIVTDRMIKGSLQGQATVSVVFPSLRDRSINPIGLHGIFFARTSPSGAEWEIVSPMGGGETVLDMFYSLSKSQMAPASSPDDSSTDRVIRELAAAFERRESRLGPPIDLVGMVRAWPTVAARAEAARLSTSSDPIVHAIALKAGISIGDVSALQRATSERSTTAKSQFSDLMDYVKRYYRSPDPLGVKVLGQLLVDGDSQDQISAASALAHIHTNVALQYLAPLLDSADPVLRSCAVGGLALFANNVPIGENHPAPGEWKYRTNETMQNSAMDADVIKNNSGIITFWKAWWQQNRFSLN